MLTAAVIHAGLGTLSFGLQRAGFRIAAAYESDPRVAEIHTENFNAPVHTEPLDEIAPEMCPKVDVLAAHIHLSPLSNVRRKMRSDADEYPFRYFEEWLGIKRPAAFLLMTNPRARSDPRFSAFLRVAGEMGYRVEQRLVSVAEATGLAVGEHAVCVTGLHADVGDQNAFPVFARLTPRVPTERLQLGEPLDPWYFRGTERVVAYAGEPFLCWRGDGYKGSESVSWNTLKPPLLNDGGRFRKFTCREIARWKGLPESYQLPEQRGKSWLHRKLMVSVYAQIVEQAADALYGALMGDSWKSGRKTRQRRFETLFASYLKGTTGELAGTVRKAAGAKESYDLTLEQAERKLCFSLKLYKGRRVLESRLYEACRAFTIYKTPDVRVLVVANEAAESAKDRCLIEYGVYVWDVGDLLWLFAEDEKLRSAFIRLLDYDVDRVKPTRPRLGDAREGTGEARFLERMEADALRAGEELLGDLLNYYRGSTEDDPIRLFEETAAVLSVIVRQGGVEPSKDIRWQQADYLRHMETFRERNRGTEPGEIEASFADRPALAAKLMETAQRLYRLYREAPAKLGPLMQGFLEKTLDSRDSEAVFVPMYLAREIVAFLPELPQGGTVLSAPVGSGSLLLAAGERLRAENVERYHLRGVEDDPQLRRCMLLLLRFFDLDAGVEASGTALAPEAPACETILSAPLLRRAEPRARGRAAGRWDKPSAQAGAVDPAYLQSLLSGLKEGGRCALVVPEALLQNRTSEAAEMRRWLLGTFSCEAVLPLPADILAPGTSFRAALMLLRRLAEGERAQSDRLTFFARVDAQRQGGREPDDIRYAFERVRNAWEQRQRYEEEWLHSAAARNQFGFSVPENWPYPYFWFGMLRDIRENGARLVPDDYAPDPAQKDEADDPELLLEELSRLSGEIARWLKELTEALHEQ